MRGERKLGRFVYSHSTGRLDIAGDFKNGTYDNCVYGVSKRTGKHIIIAGEFTSRYSRIWPASWASEPGQLPPEQRKALEEAAEREANKYKYVTQVGDDIQPEDIEAIVYASDLAFGIETALMADAYLLMKDGRVMDGVPIAAHMLDVSKSRSREADKWDYWKNENGIYNFAWDADQRRFVQPAGDQVVAKPLLLIRGWTGNGRAAVQLYFLVCPP